MGVSFHTTELMTPSTFDNLFIYMDDNDKNLEKLKLDKKWIKLTETLHLKQLYPNVLEHPPESFDSLAIIKSIEGGSKIIYLVDIIRKIKSIYNMEESNSVKPINQFFLEVMKTILIIHYEAYSSLNGDIFIQHDLKYMRQEEYNEELSCVLNSFLDDLYSTKDGAEFFYVLEKSERIKDIKFIYGIRYMDTDDFKRNIKELATRLKYVWIVRYL